jgi:hypothetical protein
MATVQFNIPRLAANAVDFPAVRKAGHAAGLEHTWIEVSDYRASEYGRTRITCSPEMAFLSIQALRAVAADATEHGKSDLVIACAEGVASAFAAIDAERARPSDEPPAGPTKPAPN